MISLVFDQLFQGMEKGYGKKLKSLDLDTPDGEMMKALRNNLHVFSGFKNYQMLKAASELLTNEAGELLPFSEFKAAVTSVFTDYNQNWLFSEYQLAIGQSQIASKWMEIERDKEVLPYLQFVSVKDSRARHKQYDGITRKVDDPVWNYLTPLLDWGCRCTLKQLADGENTPGNKIPQEDLFKPMFRMNPGKDKTIFPESHPYFNVDAQTREQLNNKLDDGLI